MALCNAILPTSYYLSQTLSDLLRLCYISLRCAILFDIISEHLNILLAWTKTFLLKLAWESKCWKISLMKSDCKIATATRPYAGLTDTVCAKVCVKGCVCARVSQETGKEQTRGDSYVHIRRQKTGARVFSLYTFTQSWPRQALWGGGRGRQTSLFLPIR